MQSTTMLSLSSASKIPFSFSALKTRLTLGARLSRVKGSSRWRRRTLQDVKTLCLKYNNEPVAAAARQEEPETNDEIESNRTLTGAEKLKRRRREMSGDSHRSNPIPAANRVDLEISNYETNINEEDDFSEPLDWWYRNRSTYPILYQAAGEILSIPASSASSERAFSVATRVLFVNILVLIHSNLLFKGMHI